jgi:hypothetical protein
MSPAPILETLSREQKAIVFQCSSPKQTVVIGGPGFFVLRVLQFQLVAHVRTGSGKSYLIAARIAHLISKQNVAPSDILALTFSETNARTIQVLQFLHLWIILRWFLIGFESQLI